MKIQPIRDRILVKPLEAESVSKFGIVIPDNAKEKPQKGTAVKVGEGRVTKEGNVISMAVKENDVVLYGQHAGTKVKIDEVEYIVLSEDDVLAIVE